MCDCKSSSDGQVLLHFATRGGAVDTAWPVVLRGLNWGGRDDLNQDTRRAGGEHALLRLLTYD